MKEEHPYVSSETINHVGDAIINEPGRINELIESQTNWISRSKPKAGTKQCKSAALQRVGFDAAIYDKYQKLRAANGTEDADKTRPENCYLDNKKYGQAMEALATHFKCRGQELYNILFQNSLN